MPAASPTVVGSTSVRTGGGTVAVPSGTVAGQRAYIIAFGNTSGTYTTPTGFQILMPRSVRPGGSIVIYTKITDAADAVGGATWPVAANTTSSFTTLVLAGAGVPQGEALAIVDSLVHTGVAPVPGQSLLVMLWTVAIASGSRTLTVPAPPMTQLADQLTAARVTSLGVEALTAAGATGSRTGTLGGGSSSGSSTLGFAVAGMGGEAWPYEPVPPEVISSSSAGLNVTVANYTYTAGDVQYVGIYLNSAITVTLPTGWVLDLDYVSSPSHLVVAHRVLAGGDSTTAISFSTTGAASFVRGIIRGADLTTPLDVAVTGAAATTATTALSTASITTVTANTLLMTLIAQVFTASGTTAVDTIPAGMGWTGFTPSSAAAGRSMLTATQPRPTAGATGTRTSTSNLSAPYIGLALAWRPATPAAAGAAALNAAATLGAAGAAQLNAAVVLNVPALLVAAATPARPAAAALLAPAGLSSDSQRAVRSAADLLAPAALVSAALPLRTAGAALSAAALLSADSARTALALAALTAPAVLSADGTTIRAGAAQLSAPAALGTTATPVALAGAVLLVPAALTGNASVLNGGAAALSAPGALAAGALRSTVGQGALAAPASLVGAALRAAAVAAQLTARAALTIDAVRTALGVVLLPAPAALAVSATPVAPAAAVLAAPAALTAAGLRAAPAAARLDAAAALLVDPVRIIAAAAVLSAPADLSAGAIRALFADAVLSAPALLTAWADSFTPLPPRDIELDAELIEPTTAVLVHLAPIEALLFPSGAMSATMTMRDQPEVEIDPRMAIQVTLVDEEGRAMQAAVEIEISEGGEEYVHARITPKVPGQDLSAASVQMALRRAGEATVWYPADIQTPVGLGQIAALFVSVARYASKEGKDYTLAVKVADSPETLIRPVRGGSVALR